MTSPEYLGVEEAAERLGVSVRFVRRMVAERRCRFYKLGKLVRFRVADLDDFATARAVEPVQGPGTARRAS